MIDMHSTKSLVGKLILERLKENINLRKHVFVVWSKHISNLFEAFIACILSQNTSDKNAYKAFLNLKRKLGELTPRKILSTPLEEIQECIRCAGLHKRKSLVLRRLAEVFDERKIMEVFKMPLEEARRRLLMLPGVGNKTADVILLFYAKKLTFPIDTHIKRIALRLGIVHGRVRYDDIRRSLMESFPKESYLEAHLYLIALGREYCLARKPKCDVCPLNDICPKLI